MLTPEGARTPMTLKGQSILITGGTGLIGTNLAEDLRARGSRKTSRS
jgi:nucleoside-diphosphate-sugar epimerase